MSRLLPLAAIALLALAATTARAQGADDADEHIRRGIELRRAHRNAEALGEFEAAYAKAPSPRAGAQAALAELALGRWVEAERGLVAALAAEADPWILRNRAALVEALDGVRDHLGDLVVDASEPGAEVWIDGSLRAVVPLPAPLRVVAGEVVVEVRAAGHTTVRRTVRVLGRGAAITHEAFVLTATVDAVPRDDARLAVAPMPPPPAPPSAQGRRTAGWLLLGGAGVAAVVGGVATAVNSSEASIYNDDSRCLIGTATREAQCGGHRANAQAAQVVAITGFAVEGAAALAGVLILVTGARKPARVGCSIGLGGIVCGGGF